MSLKNIWSSITNFGNSPLTAFELDGWALAASQTTDTLNFFGLLELAMFLVIGGVVAVIYSPPLAIVLGVLLLGVLSGASVLHLRTYAGIRLSGFLPGSGSALNFTQRVLLDAKRGRVWWATTYCTIVAEALFSFLLARADYPVLSALLVLAIAAELNLRLAVAKLVRKHLNTIGLREMSFNMETPKPLQVMGVIFPGNCFLNAHTRDDLGVSDGEQVRITVEHEGRSRFVDAYVRKCPEQHHLEADGKIFIPVELVPLMGVGSPAAAIGKTVKVGKLSPAGE